MRGASRASLAGASEQLTALATSKAAADTLGDDLFAVAELLDSEHGLRRALTDPARAAEAKAGLIRSLLDGKVSAATLGLLAGLVSARWSVPRDLADATEELAVQAVVISADRSRKLDDLEDELFRFSRLLIAQPELRAALADPYLPADRKRGLVAALLDGKSTPATELLITQAALHPRGRTLETNLESYARVAAEQRQRVVAVVRVASALSQRQADRLAGALAAVYGHDVHLNIVLDPQVLGGMSIQVGDEFIDASVVNRLAALRRRLAG
jgi:F-type H+-transporting ATPase subunit delta